MIEVKDIGFNIGTFALKNVSLHIASSEYFVLLGPTGAGKSLLIQCISGLNRVRSGSIRIDDEDVTHLEPRLRKVGYVPQDAGLFPHMNVEDNITFSLRVCRMGKQKALDKVAPLVDMLKLGALMKRSPVGLSGGERQKVALARALAIEPKVLLLDEPVSALDEPTRQHVCAEVRRVQKELQVTTIHVSHNLEEALAVSDRAGILHEGRLIQHGPMAELLRQPRNEIVARFLRAENIFAGTAKPLPEGGSLLRFEGHEIRVAQKCNGDVKFMIRPELLRVEKMGTDGPLTSVPTFSRKANPSEKTPAKTPSVPILEAELIDVADRGVYNRLEFDAGTPIVVFTPANGGAEELTPGEKYAVTFPPESIHILE